MKKAILSNKVTYYLFSVLVIVSLFMLAGCGQSNNQEAEVAEVNHAERIEVEKNPVATIVMENSKEIKIELYPNIAPNTVLNFIALANDGFYDGLIFHRVIPGFMIQGGDPDGAGMGGPGYSIKGEFEGNGFKNELKHEEGVISMARSNSPDSGGSQFFIMVEEASHLDGQYAAFGKVIEGMETVKEIVSVERNDQDKPLQDQKMKTVTVETFDEEYEEPEVQR
jgi:peptidyl-prolyl cis-trans isomerase B (cyclophilin B)